jgi:hypothetical protein
MSLRRKPPANAAWRARLAKFNPAHGPWDGAVDTTCRLPRNWDTMTLDALWSALNAPRRHPTPQSTIDALAIKRRAKKLPDSARTPSGKKDYDNGWNNENAAPRKSDEWIDWPEAQTCEACGATFMPRFAIWRQATTILLRRMPQGAEGNWKSVTS